MHHSSHGYGTYSGMTTGHANVVRGHRAVCIVYRDAASGGASPATQGSPLAPTSGPVGEPAAPK